MGKQYLQLDELTEQKTNPTDFKKVKLRGNTVTVQKDEKFKLKHSTKKKKKCMQLTEVFK